MDHTMTSQLRRGNAAIRYASVLAMAAALGLGGAGCHRSQPTLAPEITTVRVAASEDIDQARDASTEGVRYTGSITANTQVELSFKQGGYVEQILQVPGEDGRLRWVQQGDSVRQGQTLARVRPGDYTTRVSMAQAQQSQSQAGLAAAQAALLQARAGADQATAGLREANAGEEASVAAVTVARSAITLAEQQTEAGRIGRQAAEAQRSEARAGLNKARQDFDRAEALYKTQSLTRSDYDAARAAFDAATARLSQADEGVRAAENRILQAGQQERQAQGQEKQAVAQVAARRSQVRQAQARIDASREMVQAAEAQVANARAAMAGASAQVRAAQIPLEETCLRAPLDGILLRRSVEVGSLVGPTAPPAFSVADTSKVKVAFGVPDSQMKSMQLGQRVPVRVDVFGPTPFPGRITSISPSADPRTRVFNVEVTVANPGRRLKVGMIATLDLAQPHGRDGGVAVPVTAIVRQSGTAGGAAVLVVSQDAGNAVAHLRPVRLGSVYGSKVSVEGIGVGEQVITDGVNRVHDGEAVRIAEKPVEDDNVGQN